MHRWESEKKVDLGIHRSLLVSLYHDEGYNKDQ